VLAPNAVIAAYSLDLRERAVALLDEGASSPEVAELLGVSESWARKMRLRRDRLGHLRPSVPPGKERVLTKDDESVLRSLVDERPDATLEEYVEMAAKRLKVRVSISTMSRRLIELGLTRKKRLCTPPRRTGQRSSKSANASCVAMLSSEPDGWSSSTRRASTCR
jgi:transposase